MKLLSITSIALIAYKTSALASATSEATDRSQHYLNMPAADGDNDDPRQRNLRSDVAEMAGNVNQQKTLGYIGQRLRAPKPPRNTDQLGHHPLPYQFPTSLKHVRPDQLQFVLKNVKFRSWVTAFRILHGREKPSDVERKMFEVMSEIFPDDRKMAAILAGGKKKNKWEDQDTWDLANRLENQLFKKWIATPTSDYFFEHLKVNSNPETETPLLDIWLAFMHRKFKRPEDANEEILKVYEARKDAVKNLAKNKEKLFRLWTAKATNHFKSPKK